MKRGKPLLSRDNFNGAPGVIPFPEVTLSFLDRRLLLEVLRLVLRVVPGGSASSFVFVGKRKNSR
jgi:hypothetical protein